MRSEIPIIIRGTKNCESSPRNVTIAAATSIEKKSTSMPPSPELGMLLSKCSIIGISAKFETGAPILRMRKSRTNAVMASGSVMTIPVRK